MKKSLIGRFVNWWLSRNGWPQAVTYAKPFQNESAPPWMVVAYGGKLIKYVPA